MRRVDFGHRIEVEPCKRDLSASGRGRDDRQETVANHGSVDQALTERRADRAHPARPATPVLCDAAGFVIAADGAIAVTGVAAVTSQSHRRAWNPLVAEPAWAGQ